MKFTDSRWVRNDADLALFRSIGLKVNTEKLCKKYRVRKWW